MNPQAILDKLLTDALDDMPAAPDRSFVAHSTPAVQPGCASQLTVHLVSVTPKALNSNPRVTEGCVFVPYGRFAVQVWRCRTVDIAATPESLTASSAAALADAVAVWDGVTQRRKDGTLLPSGPPAATAIVSLTPLGPSGTAAGWQILLDIELSR